MALKGDLQGYSAGALRQRITVQQASPTVVRSGSGADLTDFIDVLDCWARIEPVPAHFSKEMLSGADVIASALTVHIMLRWARPIAALTPRWRIKYVPAPVQGQALPPKFYDIFAVINAGGRNRWFELYALERM